MEKSKTVDSWEAWRGDLFATLNRVAEKVLLSRQWTREVLRTMESLVDACEKNIPCRGAGNDQPLRDKCA